MTINTFGNVQSVDIKIAFQVLTYTILKMTTEIKINEVKLFQVKHDKLVEFETFIVNVTEMQKNKMVVLI